MASAQGRREEKVAPLSNIWNGRVKALFLMPVLLTFVVLSCSSEPKSLEERAQSLDKRLMCPVCPAETIDQSQAELAVQMRALVRQKLQAGEGEDDILDFFVDSYGKSVLAEPPQEGFNLVVWVVPPIALVSGLVLVWLATRHLGQRRRHGPIADVHTEGLAPYLEQVDREFQAFERVRITRDPRGGGRPAEEGGG